MNSIVIELVKNTENRCYMEYICLPFIFPRNAKNAISPCHGPANGLRGRLRQGFQAQFTHLFSVEGNRFLSVSLSGRNTYVHHGFQSIILS
jgi:hypothetical protein